MPLAILEVIIIQYGTLSSANQTLFNTYQGSLVRVPTFSVFIGGLSDISDYVMNIKTVDPVESQRGAGTIGISSVILTCSNSGNTFYSGGISTIEKNAVVRIWAGFSDLNVPVFSGVVWRVTPAAKNDTVIINAMGYMGLMREARVGGNQGETNDTIKEIVESFATAVGATSNITGGQIAQTSLTRNTLEPSTMLAALEKLVNSISHVVWFDENGVLHMEDRNYSNDIDWTYTNENTDDVYPLTPSELFNYAEVEYKENFFSIYKDIASINAHGERRRRLRVLFLNSEEVSDYTSGLTTEDLDNNLEGFKFTSSATAGVIDCVAIKMNQSGGSGDITLRIYSDDGGSPSVPDTLLGTSIAEQAAELIDSGDGFAYHYFKFLTSIEISVSTAYWGILDTTSVTGTVNVLRSRVAASDMHAYGSWTTQDNKQMIHRVKSSTMAKRVAEDLVRRGSHERIGLVAHGSPHLQKKDELLVDITNPFTVLGRYVIESRRHTLTRNGFVTLETLERV